MAKSPPPENTATHAYSPSVMEQLAEIKASLAAMEKKTKQRFDELRLIQNTDLEIIIRHTSRTT